MRSQVLSMPCLKYDLVGLIRWVALLFYFRWLGAITLPKLGPFFQFSLRSVSLFSLIFCLNSMFIVEDVELHQLNVKAPISSIPSMCSFLFHFEWNVCPWKMQNLPIKIACCYFYSADLYFLFFLEDGELIQQTLSFYRLMLVWLVNPVGGFKMPLPSTCPFSDSKSFGWSRPSRLND